MAVKNLLVTGGAGFIGSHLVVQLLQAGHRVVNVDALTYAASLQNLETVHRHPDHVFVRGNIADGALIRRLMREHEVDAIVNVAAESHVDRSIDNPFSFIQTNIVGPYELLEATRSHITSLTAHRARAFRFLQVSTDEVYGSLGADGHFCESSPVRPTSPYAASKAAAEHLVRAYQNTYDLPTIITQCTNNYGARQYPEKLVPRSILSALAGQEIQIYGDGRHVRDWICVEDHCSGIRAALTRGEPGRTYAFGARTERSSAQIVDAICRLLSSLCPRQDGGDYRSLVRFVDERPGHDFRYAVDPCVAERELGWRAEYAFDAQFARTIAWYVANRARYLGHQSLAARIGHGRPPANGEQS